MRIVRTLFILAAAVLLIPSPPDDGSMITDDPSTPQMLGAAFSTVADMRGFCGRQPGVCETAGFVAGKLEAKAKHGVRLIYEWANEGASEPTVLPTEADASDAIQTGSTTMAAAAPQQSTLTLEDLIPEWRGPAPKKS
jgi:Family of unknown function (DUF5330)